jgi:hypothetical protein
MTPEDPRSISAVVQGIVGNLQGIVKGEMRLVNAEMIQTGHRTVHAATALLIATALGQLAAGFILFACVELLATRIALWLAALIVGAVVAIAAAAFMSTAIGRSRQITPATGASLISERRLSHG